MQPLANKIKTLIVVAVTGLIALNACSWNKPNLPEEPRKSRPNVRHVILMIGDGMGGWHVDATRKYADRKLAMASLAYHGYMTTYMRNTSNGGSFLREFWDDASRCGSYDSELAGKTPWDRKLSPLWVQKEYTDSAAAASAMFSGRKTVRAALNVVTQDDGYPGDQPFAVRYRPTIVDFAAADGKATGVVTSVPFQHATPAGAVVKTQYRRNQGEKARQMIYSPLDVIMGCGHPYYDRNGKKCKQPNFGLWSRNQSIYLADENGEALFNKVAQNFLDRCFIDTKADFEDLGDGDSLYQDAVLPYRAFGLAPVAKTLQYDRIIKDGDRADDWQVGGQAYISDVPNLQTMTRGALAVLEQNKSGFWLMIEGGAVDWASHANNMTRMLEELLAFDRAVQAVIDWIEDTDNVSSWENTLLIVTADHECGHLQPVGGVTGDDVIKKQCWGVDCSGWPDHTNSLVPIYAQGPGAGELKARFKGDYRDNTDVFKVMMRALGQTSRVESVNLK